MTKRPKQNGQTIIETMVAIFILVMGITAALGLATFAYGTSVNVTKQIIATGLAREGVEAVKNMRDTNWLQGTLSTSCYNYATMTNTASCYTQWLNKNTPFCLDPTANNGNNCAGGAPTMNYFLGFDPSNVNFWNFKRQFNSSNFGLNLDNANVGGKGFYTPGTNGISCASSNSLYCRKIIITVDATAPMDKNIGPLVKVISRVWWSDKHCPKIDDWDESINKIPSATCRIELQTYLTNWKNY